MLALPEFESHEAESARLKFDTHQDALNHADKVVQDGLDWLAVHDLNVVNRHEGLALEIRLELTPRLKSDELHLVFRAVPDGMLNVVASRNHHATVVDASHADGYGGNETMFVGVTEAVQCPQSVIPSLVWLEPAKVVNKLVRQVFADAAFNVVLKLGGVVGEGESGPLFLPGGDGVTGLVEGGAEIVNGICGDAGQGDWHGLHELELMNLLAGLRIDLSDFSVWVSFEEPDDLPLKVSRVLLCTLDAVL